MDKEYRYITEWSHDRQSWVTTLIDIDGVLGEYEGVSPLDSMTTCSNKVLIIDGDREDEPNVELEVKREFKPLDVIKNQVSEFVDRLGKDDVCKLSINTEIYMGVDNTGPERAKGDEYLALVIKKINVVPDSYVLQETMKYPCKQVFEYFCEVES